MIPYNPTGLVPYEPSQPAQGSNGLRGFATGIAKGELSTLKGIGTIGQKVLDKTLNRIPGVNAGSDIYRPQTSTGQKATTLLAPQTSAEKAGFTTEQILEYFIPASKAARAEQTINTLLRGRSLLQATTRIISKGAVQGVSAGAVRYAQTGGDVKESSKAALTAGITRAGLATIGEGARALRIPERLYSTIFKNSKKDMLSELKVNGIDTLKRTNPTMYQQMVDEGIIKLGAGGVPQVNVTLAEQALDKGLRGSIRNMADEVVGKTLESEYKVQQIASKYGGTISLPEKQYVNVLKKVAQEYDDVGFGEISKEAGYLASKLESTKGNLTAQDALQFRRFLDRLRIGTSYDKPATSLSMTQSNFKTLSDSVRTKINAIPGMKNIMTDYAFYIDAIEALAREASRRGNNQVISLIDSIFLGGGLSSANPAPLLTIGVMRRMLLSGQGMTFFGQLLNKGVASPKTIGTIGAISSGVQSQTKAPIGQTQ